MAERTCLRCESVTGLARTRAWRAGRWHRGWLCRRCRHVCRQSLLYRLTGRSRPEEARRGNG
jgi:hypothetical protein